MSEACTLVTGGATGIGRGIAQMLAGSRKLILADRDQTALETVRAACEVTEPHLLWVQDLGEVRAIGAGLASLLAANETGIDHFVHCTEVFEVLPARTVEMSSVFRLFTVNLFSAVEIIRVLTSRRVNRGMLRSITFISSIATRVGMPGHSVYAASKGALNALARSLAVELAPEIRVNAILPGYIQTENKQQPSANPDFVVATQTSCPLGPGRAEDVAEAVAFLTSDRARWITGQEVVVDGGRSVL